MNVDLPWRLRENTSRLLRTLGIGVGSFISHIYTALVSHIQRTAAAISALRSGGPSYGRENRSAPFEQLPTELNLEILSHLSVKDIAEISNVNRHLNNLVSDKKHRDWLAVKRITASIERFHDTIHEHLLIATLPCTPALELFFYRRGLSSSGLKRSRDGIVFASLRSRPRAACRPDLRFIMELQALVLELFDLHISRHVFKLVPEPQLDTVQRHEFIARGLWGCEDPRLTAGTLSGMYQRATTTPGTRLPLELVSDVLSSRRAWTLTSVPRGSVVRRRVEDRGLGSVKAISLALGVDLPVIPLGDVFGYVTFSRAVWS